MNPQALRPLVALSLIPQLGSRRIRSLINAAGSAERVFGMPSSQIQGVIGLGDATARYIASFRDWAQVDRIIEGGERMGVYLLGLDDPAYPHLLLQIPDPPVLLWVKGELSALNKLGIAVIGTRQPSNYGRTMAATLTSQLCEAGLSIVSGLAYGIDAIAHDTAVKSQGITIGVLGSGIDRIYPSEHRPLANRMVEAGGCIISEFPPGTKPDAGNFPVRNRVVSGLTLGTLVIETKGEGGSMITARLALDQNREVFAVPHRVGDTHGEGCNMLIQMAGAKLVASAKDVISDFGGRFNWQPTDTPIQTQLELEPKPPGWMEMDLTPLSRSICELLEKGQIHTDDLSVKLGQPVHLVLNELLQLEFAGLVRTLPGKMVVIDRGSSGSKRS
jgi:DNA processing protein